MFPRLGLMLALFLFFSPVSSHAKSILILASDPAASESLRARLPAGMQAVGTDIEVDADGKMIRTGEGSKLAFDQIFGQLSMRDASAFQSLRGEYKPDLVLAAWFDKSKETVNKAWGMATVERTLHAALYDGVTGRRLGDEIKRTGRASGIVGAEDAGKKAGEDALRIDLKPLFDAAAKSGETPESQKIRIDIRGLTQDNYFSLRDAMLKAVQSAGVREAPREEYDRAGGRLSLRSNISADPDEFYRNLYYTLRSTRVFDKYDILKSGDRQIVVELLPPDIKRLLITSLPPERYHSRLEAFEKIFAAQAGVRSLTWQYVEGDASAGSASPMAEFRFQFDGDMHAFEKTLWHAVSAEKGLANMKLVSIDSDVIRYRAEYEPGDRIALEVAFNNITPANSRMGGARIDRIMQSLGVLNLNKSYDRDQYRLGYKFEMRAPSVDIDARIWQAIQADTNLAALAQDRTADNYISFVWIETTPESRRLRVLLNNLSPENYSTVGKRFLAALKAIEGVRAPAESYDRGSKTLTTEFEGAGIGIQDVDNRIWAALAKDADFAGMLMGGLSGDEAMYYFKKPEGASEMPVVVYLRRVGGEEYKRVGTAFRDLLASAEGVSNVTYDYDLRARTVIYRMYFAGSKLFDLDDAVARKTIGHALFGGIARGPGRENLLVFYHNAGSMTAQESAPPERAPLLPEEGSAASPPADKTGKAMEEAMSAIDVASAGGAAAGKSSGSLAQLVAKIDPGVVVIYAYTGAAGPTMGSGFFVDEKGYILTNHHVVEKGKLVVRTYDGRMFNASIIKSDPDLDLALVKVQAEGVKFPALKLGDSAASQKGDRILVIGNPISDEYAHSVVDGMISGLSRDKGRFQISAPVYSGNSGSPLLSAAGEVIGVVTAVESTSAFVVDVASAEATAISTQPQENMGFAVPVQYARALLEMVR